eukprot:CAMPEP_0173243550 /NCGR_PEP_ID=MMETSP1142-20121109/15565_1 /TAXON_ID=483371 /ORGANISM="non described non described, Strain CCMP2298" /LENGTH=121 /DNA_ID=CAMNT_0014175157 /DNA_START=285 /DNA_END=649 /DNA_ORIENTATION=-
MCLITAPSFSSRESSVASAAAMGGAAEPVGPGSSHVCCPLPRWSVRAQKCCDGVTIGHSLAHTIQVRSSAPPTSAQDPPLPGVPTRKFVRISSSTSKAPVRLAISPSPRANSRVGSCVLSE